ncbi:MAG: protein-glutamate O-methyltransferase CheR [Bdellovibrionales bacterium]|nr:protein-glutamate O-methyltransferase CheR [Bdellovibrionales bacterium]
MDPIERHLFLEGIFLRFGHDFRLYAEASLNRRLNSLLTRFQTDSLLKLLQRILETPALFRDVLPFLTINTSEFFRDPTFFRALRENVVPVLKTYSKFTIWVAGCSTGEEVLSLAILLKEENLLKRAIIHATDINAQAIKRASEGIYELSTMQTYNRNYTSAGGTKNPSDYYTAEYGLARFDPALLENVVFSEHNLATDAAFVEAHLILCRNVLIYFNRDLQDRVFDLFTSSLAYKGFLGIGSKESMRFSPSATHYETIDQDLKIYALRSDSATVRNQINRGVQP